MNAGYIETEFHRSTSVGDRCCGVGGDLDGTGSDEFVGWGWGVVIFSLLFAFSTLGSSFIFL